MSATPVLRLDNVTYTYLRSSAPAVSGLSLSLAEGESLGIVGESGSGKSTVARLIVGLLAAQAGSVQLFGQEQVSQRRSPAQVQLIFQNPYAALNPRQTCLEAIAEAAHVTQRLPWRQARAAAEELLGEVGLNRALADRRPLSLSGGQRQRVVIARALACAPRLLVADEPTSALDVSVQAQITNLLLRLRAERNLSLVMISHNLAVIGHVSDAIAVMRGGQLVESGTREQIFTAPSAAYTRELLGASTFTGHALDVRGA